MPSCAPDAGGARSRASTPTSWPARRSASSVSATSARRLRRRLYGFETVLRYADAVPADAALEARYGLERRSLDELLAEADILTLHVPLLASTKGMIGREQLAQMKASAILINTCRGDVVDEDGTHRSAAERHDPRRRPRRLRPGADCRPTARCSSMPNVMLSAHLAGTTYDTFFRRAEFAFENIAGHGRGQAADGSGHGDLAAHLARPSSTPSAAGGPPGSGCGCLEPNNDPPR